MKINLRSKRKKQLPARKKEPLLRPVYQNLTWSMDLCMTFFIGKSNLNTIFQHEKY